MKHYARTGEWYPTHRIVRYVKVFTDEVMLVDGIAYTRAEWETTSPADYERIDGEWTFQRRAFNGTVTRIRKGKGASA